MVSLSKTCLCYFFAGWCGMNRNAQVYIWHPFRRDVLRVPQCICKHTYCRYQFDASPTILRQFLWRQDTHGNGSALLEALESLILPKITIWWVNLREPQHTPGAYPRHPQTLKWKEFLQKQMVEGLGYVPGVMLENSLSKLSVGSLLAVFFSDEQMSIQDGYPWTCRTLPLKLTVSLPLNFFWSLVSNKGDSELGDHDF